MRVSEGYPGIEETDQQDLADERRKSCEKWNLYPHRGEISLTGDWEGPWAESEPSRPHPHLKLTGKRLKTLANNRRRFACEARFLPFTEFFNSPGKICESLPLTRRISDFRRWNITRYGSATAQHFPEWKLLSVLHGIQTKSLHVLIGPHNNSGTMGRDPPRQDSLPAAKIFILSGGIFLSFPPKPTSRWDCRRAGRPNGTDEKFLGD